MAWASQLADNGESFIARTARSTALQFDTPPAEFKADDFRDAVAKYFKARRKGATPFSPASSAACACPSLSRLCALCLLPAGDVAGAG
jgi:hypothetical protein